METRASEHERGNSPPRLFATTTLFQKGAGRWEASDDDDEEVSIEDGNGIINPWLGTENVEESVNEPTFEDAFPN